MVPIFLLYMVSLHVYIYIYMFFIHIPSIYIYIHIQVVNHLLPLCSLLYGLNVAFRLATVAGRLGDMTTTHGLSHTAAAITGTLEMDGHLKIEIRLPMKSF